MSQTIKVPTYTDDENLNIKVNNSFYVSSNASSDIMVKVNSNSTSLGMNSNSAGAYGIAIGTNSYSNISSTVVGAHASSSDEDSVILGYSSGGAGVVIGSNAFASETNSIAIGKDTENRSVECVVIGAGVKAPDSNYSVIIGYNASSNSSAVREQSVIIGHEAVGHNFSVAVGEESIAKENSASIGHSSFSSSEGVAVGKGARAVGYSSVAIGSGSEATEQGAVSIGCDTQALGESSIAIGRLAQVDSNCAYGMIIGEGRVSANYSIVIGGGICSGENSISLGQYAASHSEDVIALGHFTKVNPNSPHSVAIGHAANCSNSHSSIIIGYDALAYHANGSIIMGTHSTSSTDYSIVIGEDSKSTAKYSTIVGTSANSSAYRGLAIGEGAIANTDYPLCLAFGGDSSGRRTAKIYKGSTAWVISSDERLKENISLADTSLCLQSIIDVPVKRFSYKSMMGKYCDEHQTGFIAQDLEKVYPKLVHSSTEKFIDNGKEVVIKDCKTIEREPLIPVLWGAIQELSKQLEEVKEELKVLKAKKK